MVILDGIELLDTVAIGDVAPPTIEAGSFNGIKSLVAIFLL
jgi:hypothetical protein